MCNYMGAKKFSFTMASLTTMYQPKSHFKNVFDKQDWLQLFCNLNSPDNFTLNRNPLALGYRTLLSLHTDTNINFPSAVLVRRLSWLHAVDWKDIGLSNAFLRKIKYPLKKNAFSLNCNKKLIEKLSVWIRFCQRSKKRHINKRWRKLLAKLRKVKKKVWKSCSRFKHEIHVL